MQSETLLALVCKCPKGPSVRSATRDDPVQSHTDTGSCWFYMFTLTCRPESFPHPVQKPVLTPSKLTCLKLPLKNLCSVSPISPSQDL